MEKYKICPKCETNYIKESEEICDVCKGKYKTEEPKYFYRDFEMEKEWEIEEREGRKMDYGYYDDINDDY